jgi:hypothetical protein
VRSAWPGSLRTQSTVLLLATAGCTAGLATAGTPAWIATALLLAGRLGAGVQVTRSLSLRAILPPSAHAAAYSVLYAAGAVGYAVSAVVAGAVQSAAPASDAVLVGTGLTLLLIAVGAVGEHGLSRSDGMGMPNVRPHIPGRCPVGRGEDGGDP